MLSAEIIAIGSELLTPEKTDTNSLWLTEQLNGIGVDVKLKTIVGDDKYGDFALNKRLARSSTGGPAFRRMFLHAAQLSPLALTQKLKPPDWERLFAATQHTLGFWVDRLRAEANAAFPEKVTAFRKGMAVHGRYGEPCPRCGDKVLRIRYADKETNYCARCQTGGKVLADRSLSRLLGSDWPRTLEELEALKRR